MTAKVYGFPLGGVENVPELNSDDDCTYEYTTSHSSIYFEVVNYI